MSQLLEGPLPGLEAQKELSPKSTNQEKYYQAPEDARKAAVMALLVPGQQEWELVFMKRTSHPLDQHAGQISFSGGGLDKSDNSLLNCALREVEEEIGIPPVEINVIGSLTQLYVFASNNLVFPFVGYMNHSPSYILDKKEVEKVIQAPISYFLQKDAMKFTSLNLRGHRIDDVPYFEVSGEMLWGATAMMVNELLHLWKKTH